MSKAPSLDPPGRRSTAKRVAAIAGVIVLVAAAFVGGLALAHKSSTNSSASSSSTTPGSGSSRSTGSTGSGGSTGSAEGGSNGGSGGQTISYTGGEVKAKSPSTPYAYVGSLPPGVTVPPSTLPLKISISSTKNLTDGQAIAIHVAAAKGSEIFGFEARLCAPDAQFKVEYHFYPGQTGLCVLEPLSAHSDAHGVVQAKPPYATADLDFRVGEGTSTYTAANGRHASITCGHGHPCQLVLLLQVPYGFGFATYKLSYA